MRLNSCKFVRNACIKKISETCKKLKELSLRNCAGIEDAGFSYLASLSSLQHLDFYRSPIKLVPLLDILKASPHLKHLNLGSCEQISSLDEVTTALSIYNKELISIDFWKGYSLTTLGVLSLSQCTKLQEVDFGWCFGISVPGESLRQLASNCRSLKKVFLAAVRGVSDGDINSFIQNCPDLQQLDLLGAWELTPDMCFHEFWLGSSILRTNEGMVSPSKKGKLKSKERDSVAGQSRTSTTGLCQLSRGSKPLIGKKFYLDVKNHVISSRLEANLKSLGADIEVFLVKEVNYVVSDRPEWTKEGKVVVGSGTGGSGINGPQSGCGSLTPRFSSLSTPAGGTGSESPGTVDSPKEAPGKRRVKTRAEAMLVSARQQKQQTTIDPLENARSWRIPIWPVENVLKWIKKIQGSLLLKRPESRNKPAKPVNKFKELRTPYVKLETLNLESRPAYKELSAWPELNLDCPAGGCPFSVSKGTVVGPHPKPEDKEVKKNESSSSSGTHDKKSPKRMTRKARPVRPLKDGLRAGAAAAAAGGYCEICRGDYSDLGKHLKTESHAKFAENEKNFLSLDKLINKGPNVDGFLKMNGTRSCSEIFGTRRTTRSGVNIHRTWSLDNELTIWKPDGKEDVQDPKENKDDCEADEAPRRLLVPNGHHNNIQKNLDNHFLQSPKRSRLRLSMDERVTKYGKKDQSVEVVCNGFSDSLQLQPVLKQGVKGDQDHNLRKVTFNSKDSSPSSRHSRDTGHHLRSRLVPTSEDNSNSSDLHLRHRRCRSQIEEIPELGVAPLSSVNKETDENVKNNGKICSGVGFQVASALGESSNKVVVVRRKRLSVEERLLEDNRGQYGKELIPAKLRSSGYYSVKKETQENDCASVSSIPSGEVSVTKEASDCNGALPESESAVTKPRRAKRTELSLLSVEAESFMFGESATKDSENCVPGESSRFERLGAVLESRECRVAVKSSKGEGSGQNCRTSTEKKDQDAEVEVDVKDDLAHCEDSSVASDTNDCDKGDPDHFHRRKRRTHAELFIHDNLDYYKFEISEQRLRHGESKDEKEDEGETVIEEVAIKEEADLSIVADVEEEVGDPPVEAVETKKAWDDPEVVKFSFESIPFSEPWYQTYQRQDEGEEIHFTSFSESSPFKPFSLPYESHIDVISKFGFKRTGFQKKRSSGVGKNARKSPRCHASTLAIMSSLMAKRRKESKVVKPAAEKQTNRVSLPSSSNSDFKSDSDKEIQEIAKNIEVMLDGNCIDEGNVKIEDSNPVKMQADKSSQVHLEDLELDFKHLICEDELLNYAVNDTVPDVVSLLDSFPDCDCVVLSEEERGAINEAYERGISELKERLNPVPAATKPRGNPGRPRKREQEQEVHADHLECDSTSETASTCGTVSEVGSLTCKISRKKKRRNRTGWPRQLPKRKKIEFGTSIDPIDSPVIPVRVPGRRGRPRKYPLKGESISPKISDSKEPAEVEEKDLKCTKMSTRQSNKDVSVESTTNGGKLSEGPTIKENPINVYKTSGSDSASRPNSSPNYSSRTERVSANRLSMTSPESGVRKYSLARRRLINQNRRESPRKVKPQIGTKWDVWSIRKRR
ncbi:hypothetical protein J437_LFUL008746 [Ladona fulva]|uniref:DBF4-type domain-containing protein n=1 Tax=Ladona fulva TaxID=123851 RepID=A0A8K0K411_LADFU|nr:hypothetical protein J437_LFUL008746 [Ladona fulva]